MSKMGSTIVAVMDYVNNNKLSMSESEIMSNISHNWGDMFTAIAEEYYNDSMITEADYSEVYDIEAYESMMEDLEREGIIS